MKRWKVKTQSVGIQLELVIVALGAAEVMMAIVMHLHRH